MINCDENKNSYREKNIDDYTDMKNWKHESWDEITRVTKHLLMIGHKLYPLSR